jgi:hypothetical protein
MEQRRGAKRWQDFSLGARRIYREAVSGLRVVYVKFSKRGNQVFGCGSFLFTYTPSGWFSDQPRLQRWTAMGTFPWA